MTQKGYINDFYRQFEEVNYKLDQVNKTINLLSINNSQPVSEIKNLNKKLEEANSKNQELLLEGNQRKKFYF